MSMTYKEAMEYISAAGVFGSRPGLTRIKKLCSKLGDPQKDTNFIHVAGTNGKGSVCAMLDSVLRCAGLKVGLYTSPYISFFEERIRLDGKPVSKRKLTRAIEKVKSAADSAGDEFTEFEIITAAAFLCFDEEKCDVVVLETGLGGRLDATNVIDRPLVSVITGIALDHTAVLGETEEKIAAEKGGIIKRGCPVVAGDCSPAVKRVIEEIAAENSAPVIAADYGRIKKPRLSIDGTEFTVEPYGKIKLTLSGAYQAENAAVCITAVEALKAAGVEISSDALKEGLYAARWPARFETLLKEPLTVYDGAHNENGAKALERNIRKILGGRVILVTGVMADKDCAAIIKTLAPCAMRVFTVTPENPRSLCAERLAQGYKNAGADAVACASVKEGIKAALTLAKKEKLPIVIAGTLYLYKQITDELKALLK